MLISCLRRSVEDSRVWPENGQNTFLVHLVKELADMKSNEAGIEDAFYRDLAFGTGGLRGVIGAGTNRMNIYTVAKASQGLSNYVKSHFDPEKRKIAVSFDSRIK